MNPTLTTEGALRSLAEGRVHRVYLIKPGHFGVLVTFDAQTQEFVFAEPWLLQRSRRARRKRAISVVEILFQTTPYLSDYLSVA